MTTVLDRRQDAAAEPRIGAEHADVRAVNRKAERDLYAGRQKIYSKLAHGRFRTIKWIVMAVTLGIYYALPWMRWSRGPDLPNQAVLLDMPNNRYFFFFLEIWPQEFYYVTGLLVLAALVLFLFTSLAGRIWCGYTCPQTVWTDLMITVERLWQGDRAARIRLDKAPWGPVKIFKKTMTHLSWMAVGLATGGAMVFYFRDAPTLARELLTGQAPFVAYLFLGLFAGFTYLLGGLAREQVCIYMCPWPRIQGAMTDRQTMLVSYHPERGEPRAPHKKGQTWEGRGDCIDCKACVVVCPTGIDIRDGSQLECIQCALCIDACNEIMDRVGRPRGLIAYDTPARSEARGRGEHEPFKPIRARTMIYVGLFALVGAIMLWARVNRSILDVNVLHDRDPAYVQLSDGGVRNGYTVKILNKLHDPRQFKVTARNLPEAGIAIVGVDAGAGVEVPTDDLRELRVYVTVPQAALAQLKGASDPFAIVVVDVGSGVETSRQTNFQTPAGIAGKGR